jgi:hypothetical protein
MHKLHIGHDEIIAFWVKKPDSSRMQIMPSGLNAFIAFWFWVSIILCGI